MLLVLPLATALLVGCAADPADERRDAVASLTEAANARDAARLRTEAEALLELLDAQRASQDLAGDEAERLRGLVEAVLSGADVIDEDLIERRRAEAEAEAARLQLEEAQRQLEEEREKSDEDEDKGRGKKDDGKDDDD